MNKKEQIIKRLEDFGLGIRNLNSKGKDCLDGIIEDLKSLPEDKEGDVVEIKLEEGKTIYPCICHNGLDYRWDYCPRCGKNIKRIGRSGKDDRACAMKNRV